MDGATVPEPRAEESGPGAPREPLPTAANALPRPTPDAVFSGLTR